MSGSVLLLSPEVLAMVPPGVLVVLDPTTGLTYPGANVGSCGSGIPTWFRTFIRGYPVGRQLTVVSAMTNPMTPPHVAAATGMPTGGPALVSTGSETVFFGGLGAARQGLDTTAHEGLPGMPVGAAAGIASGPPNRVFIFR